MIKIGKKKNDVLKTETQKLDESRKLVLSKGRKFRYPIQYEKHKLVFNTIIISLVLCVIFVVFGWFMLYRVQDTGDFIYRLTDVVPISVANVDGEEVRYSDYLMLYRSSIRSAEQQSGQLGNDEDSNLVRLEYKQSALQTVEKYALSIKLGRELSLSVSENEIDEEFDKHRVVGGVERTKENFLKIISDNFGLSEREYRRMLYLLLLKEKVEIKIDSDANSLVEKVQEKLKEVIEEVVYQYEPTEQEIGEALIGYNNKYVFASVIKNYKFTEQN